MGNLPSFSRDIREFIALLKKHEVRFLIVGGAAVIFHGYARYTGDVDFFYESSEDNSTRLHAAIYEFWQGEPPGGLALAELMREGQILQYGVPPHRIDLINRIDGVTFAEAWSDKESEPVSLDGKNYSLDIIGKATLQKNKAASRREKDLDDLKNLER